MTRTRSRPINTSDAPAAQVTTEMKTKARAFFDANQQKNKHSREADKHRKELLALMTDGNVRSFGMTTKIGNKQVSLDVEIDTPDRVSIDPAILRKLVDEETFMKIVSATKTSVEAHAGSVIAAQASVTSKGTTNVNVKAAK